MQPIPIPFAIRTNTTKSTSANSQLLVNMYAEINEEGAKYPYTLYNTPGLRPYVTLGSGIMNGMHVMGELLFVVSGANVYKIDTSGVATLIGNIGTTSNRVYMEDNGTQVAILKDDGTQFVATTSTVTQVTDADYQDAYSMTSADGYGIYFKRNSNQMFISDLLDFSAYDALDFTNVSEKSDIGIRPYSFNNAIWALKETSIEIYSNTGDQDFPYQQIPGSTNTSRGCAAPFSPAQDGGTLIWLGDDRVVYYAQGYAPVPLSDEGINNIIQNLTTVSDAFGFIYTQSGHKFYCITFPTENLTLSCDLSSKLWHVRKSYGYSRWLVNCHAFFAGKNLVGDFTTGKIYELDLDYYLDDTTIIPREIITQNQYANGARFTTDRLELGVDCGLVADDSTPQMMMSFSDDGGLSWSNEKWMSVGRTGNYLTRVVWWNCGSTRQRIYKFVYTEDTPLRINGLFASIRKWGV